MLVANKRLPPDDHRRVYVRQSIACEVSIADGEDDAPQFGFSEQLSTRDFVAAIRLYRYLLQNRLDIDFVHFISTKLILFGPTIARAAGVRSIVTVTGLGRISTYSGARGRLASLVYRLLARGMISCTEVVLFQNLGNLKTYGTWFPLNRGKLTYVGSGIDTRPDLACQRGDRRASSPLIILHVARAAPGKGIEEFLHIADSYADDTRIRFVLAGGLGDRDSALARSVRQAAERGAIDHVGELAPKDLHRLMASATALLFLSHGEGAPRAVMESGAFGLCPIVFDVTGCRDLVDHTCGYRLSPGDMGAALDLVEYALSSEGRLEFARRGEAFRRRILAEFSAERYVSRMDEIMYSVARGDIPPDPQSERPLHPAMSPASPTDVEGIVSLHLEAFPGSFLSVLGPGLLRTYYSRLLEDTEAISFVATYGETMAGFVVGLRDPAEFYGALWSDRRRILRLAATRLLRHPRFVFRGLWNARRVANRGAGMGEDWMAPGEVELTSLAVNPESQGDGVGYLLTRRFVSEVRSRGLEGIWLTTEPSNARARRLYERIGFEARGEVIQPGRRRLVRYHLVTK